MGVVYHSNYFVYFETARTESIRELGYTYADMEKMGVIMPVIDVHCRYLRPAKYDELLTIKTILKNMPSRHKIEFNHEVFNEKGELLATGKINLCFLEAGTLKPAIAPAELLEKLTPYFG
jgi:acyl-CoA thioester hydrolase